MNRRINAVGSALLCVGACSVINSTEDLKRLQATLKPGDAVAFRIMTRQGRAGEWASSFVAGTLPANGR